MGQPARPSVALHEGPNESCVIDGRAIGWTNCTPTGTAMGIDKATLGAKRPSPCDVRRLTGDVSGGTTLLQVAAAAEHYGVKMEVHVGSNVSTPAYVASQLRAGRGLDLQGNAIAMVGTRFRSTAGRVNHNVYVNEGRGWLPSGLPAEVLVYDPAADGRTAGWGTSTTSPDWWPWGLAMKFAALLQPWGDGDPRTIGYGKIYCAFFPDTEPHAHLKFGAARVSPLPQMATAYAVDPRRRVNVRNKPTTTGTTVVLRLSVGATFAVFQKTTTGQLLAGSRVWYGDHDGTRWVHSSGLKGAS